MIGQTTSHIELTPARLNDFSRSGGLWSLSKFREGRCDFAGASPSLKLEKGIRGDEFDWRNSR